jgi:hypothetical protein
VTDWQKMLTRPGELNRQSVEGALADYVLDINQKGYRPDPSKVLAVRGTDRTAWLRRAALPTRWEAWYYIEGELFPEPGSTRLPEGETPLSHARNLTEGIWEKLRAWSGYDFTPTSYGLNHMLEPLDIAEAGESPNGAVGMEAGK